jgi:hypothetical protein
MHLPNVSLIGIAAISAGLLSACGGGGGGNDSNTNQAAATTAEGLYTGTSNGRTITGLVLDDGSYYVLYTVANNPILVAGVIQGSGTSSNGSFTSANAVDISIESRRVVPGVVSASYVQKQSFSGTISYPSLNGTSAFTSTYSADYEIAPSLNAIAGTYNGTSGSASGAESANLTISSTGAITGSGSSGCSFAGTITPRAKGNAYNASITFGGSPCLFANQTIIGGAYYNAEVKRLYAVGLPATRTNGVVFVGTKL